MRPFCRENMDYILNDERYSKKMADILRPGTLKSILKLIEWKHFHKKHPENWNIKSDPDSPNFLVFNGKAWVSMDPKDAVQRLFDRLCDDIDNFIGYAKEKQIPIETKKFCEKFAKPMLFDMMHLEVDVDNYTLEMEDIKENFHELTIEHIKILSQNNNGQPL